MSAHYFEVSRIFLRLFLLLLLVPVYTLAQSQKSTIKFSFSGYGNPQRPFPGYVGVFQLGPSRIEGSGEIDPNTGLLVNGGLIGHSDDLRDYRYPSHRTNWKVVKLLDFQSVGGVSSLKLGVQVTGSNIPAICPVGTYGVIDLVDDNRLLSNRLSSDWIRTEMPNPPAQNSEGSLACGTHSHGMNNVDYSWTDPPRGGYGIWANVTITGGSRAPLQITGVNYPQHIRWNAQKGDLAIYWKGDAQFPVNLVFAPRTCPAGLNCVTERRTFSSGNSPIVAKGVIWCSGSGGFVYNWDYEVYLQDASGAISNRVSTPGSCR